METQAVPNESILHAESNQRGGRDNSPATSHVPGIPKKSNVARKSTEEGRQDYPREEEDASRVQIPPRSSSIDGGCMGSPREDEAALRVQIPLAPVRYAKSACAIREKTKLYVAFRFLLGNHRRWDKKQTGQLIEPSIAGCRKFLSPYPKWAYRLIRARQVLPPAMEKNMSRIAIILKHMISFLIIVLSGEMGHFC